MTNAQSKHPLVGKHFAVHFGYEKPHGFGLVEANLGEGFVLIRLALYGTKELEPTIVHMSKMARCSGKNPEVECWTFFDNEAQQRQTINNWM